MDAIESWVESTLPDVLPPTSIAVGLVCLAMQIVFYFIFAYVAPAGPWRDEPGFTAHQVVVLPLVSYIAYVGTTGWLSTPLMGYNTAADRITRLHAIGTHITKVALGELVIWDIPTGFAVASMRTTDMLLHHVLFAGVAYLSYQSGAFSYWAVLFFGAIEVSSVPLAWVDICHPKHMAWCEFADRHAWMGPLNLAMRSLFVLLYFIVRIGIFPYYIFTGVLTDSAELLKMAQPPVPAMALVGVSAFGVALTMLQLYWGVLLMKQIKKMLTGPKQIKAV